MICIMGCYKTAASSLGAEHPFVRINAQKYVIGSTNAITKLMLFHYDIIMFYFHLSPSFSFCGSLKSKNKKR